MLLRARHERTTCSYLELLQVLRRSLQCIIHLIHLSAVALSDGALDTGFASHVAENNVGPLFGFGIGLVNILY